MRKNPEMSTMPSLSVMNEPASTKRLIKLEKNQENQWKNRLMRTSKKPKTLPITR